MLTSGPLCRYSTDLSLVLDVLLSKNKSQLQNYKAPVCASLFFLKPTKLSNLFVVADRFQKRKLFLH